MPVVIGCRDRLTPLLALLDYLERAGCEQIHLVDNDSTYPPLLEFYESTPHRVVKTGRNLGGVRGVWGSDLIDALGVKPPFVFSDPDIVPIEECPLDAIDYFAEILAYYPNYLKVGFGLKIDDLPDHYAMKDEAIAVQSVFRRRRIAPRLFDAAIHGTFALFREPTRQLRPAIRTDYPYLARHTSWYIDSALPSEEDRYYRDHAHPAVAHWHMESLSPALIKTAKRRAARQSP
jgi:hypothetical protein